MKTAAAWWSEVKKDPEKFNEWLRKQYRGEVTASTRIIDIAGQFKATPDVVRILMVIAEQEAQHADWVKDLLVSRGIQVGDVDQDILGQRYWPVVYKGIKDFASAMAVAAHAEAMRLERIMAIAHDSEAPDDVRSVFQKILLDELFHERTFRSLAGENAMADTAINHAEGRQVLGLVA